MYGEIENFQSMTSVVRVCNKSDLSECSARGFISGKYGTDEIFIVRQGCSLYAYLNSCPHVSGTSLAWRKDSYLDSSARAIVCSAHGARFEISSGLCVVGPCKGQYLTRIPLHLDSYGGVYIECSSFAMTGPV